MYLRYARLRKPQGSWCAKYANKEQYIQVDLGEGRRITGIATQGNNKRDDWVLKYQVKQPF